MANDGETGGPNAGDATEPAALLVCFAVKEEAAHFRNVPACEDGAVVTWITGMGRRNSSESIRQAVAVTRPERVLTCGFAGGLDPALDVGTVVFDEDYDAGFSERLLELGAVPGRFHCSKRVAITVAEKRQLREATGADAVEMESSVIRTICRELRIPSATVRVISDTAGDDLPLDFNALMTPADRLNYWKLAWTLLTRPRKIPKLMAFQQQTSRASARLGRLLQDLLRVQDPD